MKYLKLLSFLFVLSLISCQKEKHEEEPDENAPVVTMLEVESYSSIPKEVTKVRLTELLKDTYVEMIPETNIHDTAKAVLSISYKKVPKRFNALISVYRRDGSVEETKVSDIDLLNGRKCTYFVDMFKVGFTIRVNDKWIDTIVVKF
ncbi:hypothetical protein B0I27_101252 [Arcticibacter pallidicorallinus]|uniref:Lipoprotein n=1 Tax=Arcticibacter pallidicorallinus TaxID=1259464 RepID=A0A2T0UBJ2_9SPHI|nr:hypothetical protein [Arcticibacter pallidicorallinus]PRY55283.1 hypothetical protein B0I27_101252 [Arcticibacter pallidicorallinus]